MSASALTAICDTWRSQRSRATLVRPDFTVRRSIRGLAEQMGVTRKSLEPMSAKFDWVARAEEYDSYILDCVAAQNTAQIVKMHEKHAAIAEQMLRKATGRLLTHPGRRYRRKRRCSHGGYRCKGGAAEPRRTHGKPHRDPWRRAGSR